jgi:hypothetical protein
MRRPPAFKVPGDLQTELPAPVTDSLVGDVDPPFGEDFLNVPEAQVEAVV